MKGALTLIATGVIAAVVAVLGYAVGAAQLGTASSTAALLAVGAGLALVNDSSRATAHQQRR